MAILKDSKTLCIVIWLGLYDQTLIDSYHEKLLTAMTTDRREIVVASKVKISKNPEKRSKDHIKAGIEEPAKLAKKIKDKFNTKELVTTLKYRYTAIDVIKGIRTYANNLYKAWEIDHIEVYAPSIFIYMYMYLIPKYLWPVVGYAKDEYQMYCALIDVFKTTSIDRSGDSFKISVWKFDFIGVCAENEDEDWHNAMFSSLRELICDRYPDLNEDYADRKKL